MSEQTRLRERSLGLPLVTVVAVVGVLVGGGAGAAIGYAAHSDGSQSLGGRPGFTGGPPNGQMPPQQPGRNP